jgi:cytochrome c
MQSAKTATVLIRRLRHFRTLSGKYPVEDLTESLAEGIVSGHPDMPIFVFSPHDVEAIIQYLQSIQIKKP